MSRNYNGNHQKRGASLVTHRMKNNEKKKEKSTHQNMTCRICLEEDIPENMIVPCKCRGSALYVHRNCLDEWRSQNPSGENFSRCNQCRFRYIIEEPSNKVDEAARQKAFKTAVKIDMILMIIIISFMIIGIGCILYIMKLKILRCAGVFRYFIFSSCICIIILYFMGCIERTIAIPFGLTSFGTSFILSLLMTGMYNGYLHMTNRIGYHRRQIWLREEAQIRRVKDFRLSPLELNAL